MKETKFYLISDPHYFATELGCSGNATLKTENVLYLTRCISNSGTLTLEGVYDLTALAVSLNAEMVDAYGNVGGNSGFQRDAGTRIELTSGSGSIEGSVRTLHGVR